MQIPVSSVFIRVHPWFTAEKTRRRPRAAFTLIEIVVALALCAILASVVASSLVTSLRAEQAAMRLHDGSALCDRLLAAMQGGIAPTGVVALAGEEWQVADEPARTGSATNRVSWRVWEVSLKASPSVRQRFAMREEERGR